ncbi:MAG: acetylornithine deacetylase [Actinomycetota bacterium]|jgi:acetylornithine deacetylase|nr:acetylornithine deacetylase [Actinomycetota bacterium]
MQPLPEEGGAYGGSRLTSERAPEPYAFDGRGEMFAPSGVLLDPAAEEAEIRDAIAGETEWMADLLSELVRADTTLGNEEAGQRLVEATLREIGLDPVDVWMDADALQAHPLASPFDWDVTGKRNVVATWGEVTADGGRSLILNGHIDVVSPEPLARWGSRSPFGGEREDGWIHGRGAADMKCGSVAILGAVKGLMSLGLTPRAPVHIESVVEEECTGNGTLQTLLAGFTADAALVAEPFGAAITTSQVGVLWFKVRITGVPGHAAEAAATVNAIERSLHVIGALRELEIELNAAPPPPFDRFTHPINLNVGAISGGDWPSTVPGECTTHYRIALFPEMSLAGLKERIEAAVAAATADQSGSGRVLYGGFACEGYTIADDAPLVTALAAAFLRQEGTPPALVATTGTSDAGVFGHMGVPAVCFGPYAERAHGIGERVYLPSVVATAQVMGLFIRDWCGLSE